MEAIRIPLPELIRLSEHWEPDASQSPPGFRKATCVKCGEPMTKMWHLWLNYTDSVGRRWVKELHMCADCGADYSVRDCDEI